MIEEWLTQENLLTEIALLLLFLLLLLILFSKVQGKEKKIIIGYPKLKIGIPIVVAKNRKLFKKYGLGSVEFKAFTNAEEVVQALYNNEIDFGGFVALPIAFSSMSVSNSNLLFIGGLIEDGSNKISYLIASNNSNIRSVAELKGKKIGILPTKAYEIWIEQILKVRGQIDISEVQIIHVPLEEQASVLQEGKVDALFTNYSSNLLPNFGHSIDEQSSLVPECTNYNPFYFGSLVLRSTYELDNPREVRQVTKAIDEAIEFLRKSKYSKINSLIQDEILAIKEGELQALNFRKSYEIQGEMLEMKYNYYLNQKAFTKDSEVDIASLQYRDQTLSRRILNSFKGFVNTVEEFDTTVVMFMGFIGIFVTLILSYWQGQNQIDQFREEMALQKISIPAQFELSYENINEAGEQALLTNIGESRLEDLRTEWSFYFIDSIEKVLPSSELPRVVSNDSSYLRKLSIAGIIDTPEELTGLFGTNRIFATEYLEPVKKFGPNPVVDQSQRNSTLLEISSSAIQNALKVSQALDAELFMRWQIRYKEELTRQEKIQYKYYWLTKKTTTTSTDTRRNLDFVIGGSRIIRKIEDYEQNSLDVIFNRARD